MSVLFKQFRFPRVDFLCRVIFYARKIFSRKIFRGNVWKVAQTLQLNLAQLLRLRAASHTSPLFYLRKKKLRTRQWKSTLSRQDRTALDQKNPYNRLEHSYSHLSRLIQTMNWHRKETRIRRLKH